MYVLRHLDPTPLSDCAGSMNYDVNGHWNSPPLVDANAPLDESCAPSEHQTGSATSAVANWVEGTAFLHASCPFQ